ncbi:hypothetical protein QQX12_02190 [Demequina sp. SYSU T00039-1]|uniref:hypothetical protein n=1 Tax=Demequina lignilytica TaxID=3051663 RepID=UPI00261E6039|nr:hypothetical protein [Demequina sp. SYSU T00039-1]MDN4477449.1 hypothetical protein [Demequina sp. SYSU T00039-1]
MNLGGSASHNGTSIAYSISVAVGGPVDSYLDTGFTLTFNLPRSGGTWGTTPAGWSRSGNVFTYLGGRVSASTVTLSLSHNWNNGSGLQGSTTAVSLSGQSGFGAVSQSRSYLA